MADTVTESIDDVINTTTQADLSLDVHHSIDENIEKSFDAIIDIIYDQIPEIVDVLLGENADGHNPDALINEKKEVVKTQRSVHTSNIKQALHSQISNYRQSFMNYKSKILNQLYDTRKSVAEHRKSYEIGARQRENERIRVLVTKLTSEHEEIVSKLSADLEEYTTGYHVVRDRNAEYIMENARLSEIIINLEEKTSQTEAALTKAQNQIKELEVKKARPTGKRLTMKKPSRSVITKSHSLDAYAQKLTSGNSTPESSRRSTGSRRPLSRGEGRRESRASVGTPESRDRRESRASIATLESRDRRESRASTRDSESRERRPSSRSSERTDIKDKTPPPTSADKIEIVNMASLQAASIDTSSASTLTMLPHDISGIVEGPNEDQSVKVGTPPSEPVTEPINRNPTETSADNSGIEHMISEESVVTTPSIDRSVNSEDRETETMSRDYGSQDYEDGSVYGESEYGETESLPTDRHNTEAIRKLREYENVIRIQKQEMENSEKEITTLKVQLSELMELYTAQELEVKQLKDEIILLKEMPQSSRSVASRKSLRESVPSMHSELDDSRPVTSNNEQSEIGEGVRYFNINSTQSLQSFASKDSLARREQDAALHFGAPDSARQSIFSDDVIEERDSFPEEPSVSVPNTARSHRLSTPLQPIATRFMGGEVDNQPAKVEVDVYNMLTEAVNVQRRLESELLQNNKERAELQAKIRALETYTANQDFLHKLKLRERGILLKELSDQVNELRRHVLRDKKIIAEKNRSLPSVTKPLRDRSPIDQRKQEMHLFKLELSLDDADISPAVRSSFPSVTSGFPSDNQTAVVRPMSSGYPKNISQSLKDLVGSSADHKKPSLFSSSGGQFGKIKTVRPATTAAVAVRASSPPQSHDAQMLAGLTDMERQNKVKQEIASIRKQIAELVLVQETELRKLHKQRKLCPIVS